MEYKQQEEVLTQTYQQIPIYWKVMRNAKYPLPSDLKPVMAVVLPAPQKQPEPTPLALEAFKPCLAGIMDHTIQGFCCSSVLQTASFVTLNRFLQANFVLELRTANHSNCLTVCTENEPRKMSVCMDIIYLIMSELLKKMRFSVLQKRSNSEPM